MVEAEAAAVAPASDSGAGAAPEGGTTISTPSAPDPTVIEGGSALGGGDDRGNWLDGLSSDYRDNPVISKFNSADALAKEHINVQKLIGAEKVPLPQEGWEDSDWNDFYTKLGRPTDPNDYDLGDFVPPESMPWNGELQTEMVNTMHSLGLNSNQAAGILSKYAEYQGSAFSQASVNAQQEAESGLKDLQNSWGKSFNANLDLAHRAFRAWAGDEFEDVASIRLEGGVALGDHPKMIEKFASFGNRMGEHGLVGEKQTRTTLSPREAQDKLNEFMGDGDFLTKLNDSNHPQHGWAVEQRSNLYAQITAEDSEYNA